MIYCNKCGGLIKDVNEPCPTCGLPMVNTTQIANKKKRFDINLFLITSTIFIILFAIGVTNFLYKTQVLKYTAEDYTVEYMGNKWKKFNANDNSFFSLKYGNGTSTFLVFPNETVDLSLNMNDANVRSDLYNAYMNEFSRSDTLVFSNAMPEMKQLDETDYYYFGVDFQKITDSNYKGKSYYIHNANGKCLVLMLILRDTNYSQIEDDVFNVIKKIKM